jgi:hypothetical protein
MNTTAREPGGQADGSILDAIPTPEEIRRRMVRNSEENRVLRSLFRVSRRLQEQARRRGLHLTTAADLLAKQEKGVAND